MDQATTIRRVLPMQLQPGDRITDETAEWEVTGRPFMTAGGKNAHARVRKVSQPELTDIRTWGAHEKVSVRRAMSRVAVAAGIVGLLLFVEPPLDGLAGYLLFQEGHRIIGTIVLSVNAVIAAGVLFSFLPEWFHPPGLTLAAAIAHYDVNVWLGLVALVYAVAVRAWPPALVLLVGTVLVAIGGRGVVAWLSSGRSRL